MADLVAGSSDLRLTKLVAARLELDQGETSEHGQQQPGHGVVLQEAAVEELTHPHVGRTEAGTVLPPHFKGPPRSVDLPRLETERSTVSYYDSFPGAFAVTPSHPRPRRDEAASSWNSHCQTQDPPQPGQDLQDSQCNQGDLHDLPHLGQDLEDPPHLVQELPVANPIDQSDLIPTAQLEDTRMRSSITRKPRAVIIRSSVLAIILLAFVVGVVVGVLVGRKPTDQRGDAATLTAADPTPSPTMSPFQILTQSVLPTFTLNSMADDLDSPQNYAMRWLEDDYQLQDVPYSNSRLVQRFALATLYYSTQGEDWRENANWLNHSVHECLWYSRDEFIGLPGDDDFVWVEVAHYNPCELPPEAMEQLKTVNDINEMYKHLWLYSNELKGTVPLEMYLLTDLRSISFYENAGLVGPLSSHIGSLTNLEAVHFSSMPLGGVLPTELGLLPSLRTIDIYAANLEGPLPSELGLLQELMEVLLDGNGISSTIPVELSNASKLQWINLFENDLTGTIPTAIYSMPSLESFSVFRNALTGGIPSEVGLFSSAVQLDVEENWLTGKLPSELGLLTYMENFYAKRNSFTGSIPTQLGKWSSLQLFDVNSNELTGIIPEVLSSPDLYHVDFGGNTLQGSIPKDWNLTGLEHINFTGTEISGTIPEGLCGNGTIVEFTCSPFLCGCACSCDEAHGSMNMTNHSATTSTQA
jgi:Leucine-rich repeat (LRR) protein